MSRCYKVHSYLYKQSNYTKCVSEILEHRLTIIKEYSVAKLEMEFVIVKSLGKYEQDTLIVSAIIVAMLLTRLPMKRSERPTVSAYIGVIILFVTMGLLHLILLRSLLLVSAW